MEVSRVRTARWCLKWTSLPLQFNARGSLSFRRHKLDHEWVRSQIADMLGDEDPRIVAWDAIVASVTPPL